jgi:hypothetical protein
MPVSTLSSDRFTDTQSTTTRLHITADDGVPVAASRRPGQSRIITERDWHVRMYRN